MHNLVQILNLLSVNIGKAEKTEAKSGLTGINKRPQSGSVHIHERGLTGDVICDLEHHGSPEQAVYIFGQPDYDWWCNEIGRDLPAGIFGENLTISDLESAKLCVGQRMHIGDVELEVTWPRIPCVTLGVRMGDPQFVKQFLKAEKPGAYCSVVNTGNVCAGDAVRLEASPKSAQTIIERLHDYLSTDSID